MKKQFGSYSTDHITPLPEELRKKLFPRVPPPDWRELREEAEERKRNRAKGKNENGKDHNSTAQ